jgi:exonuclease SbcD
MISILHFADSHIDMAGQGRHDPHTGLPVRVQDFLNALDTIVDTAINEKVDLVIFAGDAYKDRTPVPTFQREWGRRILRLSHAGILTVLLVGNHDLSPAVGRAHALQEFETLEIPNVIVISKPVLLGPAELGGLPLQVIGLPWVSRSTVMAKQDFKETQLSSVFATIEDRLGVIIEDYLNQLDPSLPAVLTAHASVQGAVYGAERAVMLGSDMILPSTLLKDPRLDYVALGHIHKAQDLNESNHPPVVYPGSIERVDWGELGDEKFFVIARLEKGEKTEVEWRRLQGRRFLSCTAILTEDMDVMPMLYNALPPQAEMQDAAVRLIVEYPRSLESQIDESALRRYVEGVFEFHIMRKIHVETRLKIQDGQTISSMTPIDLLGLYWKTLGMADANTDALNRLASEILAQPDLFSET